ncbi:MAG: MarR family winged helix-turn-helix transcriptional regulator [Pseudomonadota bacterium]|jgi:DNA-binding MarR family transcriptional regulator
MISRAIPPADARLILSDTALDRALELFLLAEAGLWRVADAGIEAAGVKLGRSHYRLAFLLKRRPGTGVLELARLTGLSKQGASKALADLCAAGLVETTAGDQDARRRDAHLTDNGRAFEAKVSEKLHAALAQAYRQAGLEAAPGAGQVWAALAGVAPR